MRLIDADLLFNFGNHKLSDAVKYGNKDIDQQSWSFSTLMMYEIAGEIDDAETYNPWVNCSDGMPEIEDADPSGHVNIWLKDGLYSRYCMWNAIKYYENSHGVKVTHWMTPEKGPDYYEQKRD